MNDRKKSTAVVQGILAHGSPDLFLFMHLQKYIYKCYAWFKKKKKLKIRLHGDLENQEAGM